MTPKKQSLKSLLNDVLSVTQCRPVDLERILELPIRYLSIAIGSKKEPEGLRPLLEILRAFPWMLKVADHNWDEQYAKKELAHQAV